MGEQGEKMHAVSIIADDILASFAPTCDMVDSPGKIQDAAGLLGARV